jgi:hypothetical protein
VTAVASPKPELQPVIRTTAMGRLPRVSPGWHAEEDAHSQRPLAILSAILSAIWEMLGVRARCTGRASI